MYVYIDVDLVADAGGALQLRLAGGDGAGELADLVS